MCLFRETKRTKGILVDQLCFKLDWALKNAVLASGAEFKILTLESDIGSSASE